MKVSEMEQRLGWTEVREDTARPEVTWRVVPPKVRPEGRGATHPSRQRGRRVQRPWVGQPTGFAGPLGGWHGRQGQPGFSAATLGATAESRAVMEGCAHRRGEQGGLPGGGKGAQGRNLPKGPRKKSPRPVLLSFVSVSGREIRGKGLESRPPCVGAPGVRCPQSPS